MNAYDDPTGTAWLKQQAVCWRQRGLDAYRAREPVQGEILLDLADAAWHLLTLLDAERQKREYPYEQD